MYKLIGADGKEYGPISAEQVRQWIAEGRAGRQTLMQMEGSPDWKPLGTLPEFASNFGPATPSMPIPPTPMNMGMGSAVAESKVQGPAIGLIIIGILGILSAAASVIVSLSGSALQQLANTGNADLDRVLHMTSSVPMAIGSNLIGFAIYIAILLGALKMKKLNSYGFAMTSAILAMLPCSCACCIGLPIGIWALVVLGKPEVKSAFH